RTPSGRSSSSPVRSPASAAGSAVAAADAGIAAEERSRLLPSTSDSNDKTQSHSQENPPPLGPTGFRLRIVEKLVLVLCFVHPDLPTAPFAGGEAFVTESLGLPC